MVPERIQGSYVGWAWGRLEVVAEAEAGQSKGSFKQLAGFTQSGTYPITARGRDGYKPVGAADFGDYGHAVSTSSPPACSEFFVSGTEADTVLKAAGLSNFLNGNCQSSVAFCVKG